MCSNTHWSKQHATQQPNGEPTTNSNRRTKKFGNYYNQKPQVAKATENDCKSAVSQQNKVL